MRKKISPWECEKKSNGEGKNAEKKLIAVSSTILIFGILTKYKKAFLTRFSIIILLYFI